MTDAEKKAADEAATKQAAADKEKAELAKKAEAEAAAKAKEDAEFEKAKAENDGKISADQQKLLDEALGDEDEGDSAPEDFAALREKIAKLMSVIPEGSPDSHTIWGAGGVILNLGDIRTLAKYMK